MFSGRGMQLYDPKEDRYYETDEINTLLFRDSGLKDGSELNLSPQSRRPRPTLLHPRRPALTKRWPRLRVTIMFPKLAPKIPRWPWKEPALQWKLLPKREKAKEKKVSVTCKRMMQKRVRQKARSTRLVVKQNRPPSQMHLPTRVVLKETTLLRQNRLKSEGSELLLTRILLTK
jgi:hypothetical protein